MTPEELKKLIVPGRRAGNSTRIVDNLVQELFKTGECHYWDHADRLENMALSHTLTVLRGRLFTEHGLIMGTGYTVDKEKQKIALLHPPIPS